MFNLRSSKLFIAALIIVILATSAYAFADSNSMPTSSYAGEGTVTISGYTVTNIVYTYSSANPSIISFVDFDLSSAASKAGVAFNGGTLTDCGALTVSGTHAHCSVSQGVLGATALRIVASN